MKITFLSTRTASYTGTLSLELSGREQRSPGCDGNHIDKSGTGGGGREGGREGGRMSIGLHDGGDRQE